MVHLETALRKSYFILKMTLLSVMIMKRGMSLLNGNVKFIKIQFQIHQKLQVTHR